MINKIKSLLGYCTYCEKYFVYPKKRRMSSAYNYEPDNWDFSCIKCFEKHEEYWEDMWKTIREY